ncbi:MAG: hypothetical protein GYB36_02745 [Alphaproteobacteria bacterium]|nr:hypothetical protein [Alphaproteobacteria bacterium]
MLRHMIAGLAVSLFAFPALADEPVTIAEIRFGEDLLDKADEYGPRELDRLAQSLHEDLSNALSEIILADGTVLSARILDATPNRPTFEQLTDRPGLSYTRSYGRGGARLEAELISAQGEVIETYSYSWRTPRLEDARATSTWTDAERTFRRFAHRIANDLEAYEHTGS